MNKDTQAIALNIIFFKIGWVACVTSAAMNKPIVGILVAALVAAFHLSTSIAPLQSLKLLVTAAGLGLLWETTVVLSGWLEYANVSAPTYIAPAWIIAMWILFATTMSLGFRWLRQRLVLAALVGAVGGPIGFIVGEKLGAVTFLNPVGALLLIALGWAVLMPLLVHLSDFFDNQPIARLATD